MVFLKEWNQLYLKSNTAVDDERKFHFTAPKIKKASAFSQWKIFFIRDFKARLSNRQYMLINLLEAPLLALILGWFNYLIYYTFCELAFKGYTLGKLITGTKAIRNDGQPLMFKDTLLRSLSRMVPFEVFSGFGDKPWHDSWTNTTVVKAR